MEPEFTADTENTMKSNLDLDFVTIFYHRCPNIIN